MGLVRWISKVIVSSLMLLALTPAANGSVMSDLGSPQLFAQTQSGQLRPAWASRSHLEVLIRGGIARGTFRQVFVNETDDWMNAVYLMPLPEQALVHGWRVAFSDRVLEGVVKERQQALDQFNRAKAEGRRAGLMESFDDGLFQIRVANIDPRAEVEVSVELTLPIGMDGSERHFRFPTTLTPRYRRNCCSQNLSAEPDPISWLISGPDGWGIREVMDDAKSADPDKYINPVPLMMTERVAYPFSWSIRLEPVGPLTSAETPLHQSEFRRAKKKGAILIASGDQSADMDRDFWLRWRLRPAVQPRVDLAMESVAGYWYGSLNILEPDVAADIGDEAHQAREFILIVDVSGSMYGESIEQAKASVKRALTRLKPADTFNVIAFDHRVFPLFDAPVNATPAALTEAAEFVDDLEADGGTEMMPALALALDQVTRDAARLAQILFITDGAVEHSVDLYQLIRRGLGDARLSTVAMGPAPNGAFMRAAAVAGRGLYRAVVREQDVAPVLDRMMHALSRPLLTDIRVDWPVEVTPDQALVPDLHEGEPLRVLVAFNYPPSGQVRISGWRDGKFWEQKVSVDRPTVGQPSNTFDGSIAAMWAGSRAQTLMDQAVLAGGAIGDVRAEVLSLALEHHLITPFTSLIAEEQVLARPPSARAGEMVVPNQRPMTRFNFAQTATPAELWLYFGLFTLFLAVFLIAMARESELGEERPRD